MFPVLLLLYVTILAVPLSSVLTTTAFFLWISLITCWTAVSSLKYVFVTLSLLVTRVSIVSNGRTLTVNFSAFLGVV